MDLKQILIRIWIISVKHLITFLVKQIKTLLNKKYNEKNNLNASRSYSNFLY